MHSAPISARRRHCCPIACPCATRASRTWYRSHPSSRQSPSLHFCQERSRRFDQNTADKHPSLPDKGTSYSCLSSCTIHLPTFHTSLQPAQVCRVGSEQRNTPHSGGPENWAGTGGAPEAPFCFRSAAHHDENRVPSRTPLAARVASQPPARPGPALPHLTSSSPHPVPPSHPSQRRRW
jgi:hypothetical protein